MTQFPALDDLKMQEEMVRRLLRIPHPKGNYIRCYPSQNKYLRKKCQAPSYYVAWGCFSAFFPP